MSSVIEVAKLSIPVIADISSLKTDLSKAHSIAKGFATNVGKLGAVALTGIGAGVTALGGVVAGIGKLAIDAAPVEGLTKAFEGLLSEAGASAPEVLRAFKTLSGGAVASRDAMESFNKAAGLVSTDFAMELPEAMKYLTKVSAATGTDINYLLDSLVTGVGRLSAPILDNLQIQVSQAEATERAAQMFGVEADALTKTQQQAGMMNLVMEKLAANTADMPDVTDSVATRMAAFKATLQDTGDQIGMAFLPVLGTAMDLLSKAGERILPLVTGALERVAPFVATVAEAFGTFVGSLLEGESPIVAFKDLLSQLVPPEVVDTVMGIVEGVRGFIAVAQEVLEPVTAWLAQNAQLSDVLVALGAAIAVVVLPALWGIITTAAPIIAVALALAAVVILLRTAWENNFLGIQDIVASVSEFINDAIATIKQWWAEHGEAILAKVREVWDAVVAVFEWFKGQYTKLFEAFRMAFEGDWEGFGKKLREIWDETWAKIKEIGTQVWDAIKRFFTETDWGAVGRGILDGIARGIIAGVGKIKDAARNAARAALDAAKGFLGIGSPSKLFMKVGTNMMEGVNLGMKRMAPAVAAATKSALFVPQTPTRGVEAVPSTIAAAGNRGGDVVNINFGTDSVRSDRDIYLLAEQIQRVLDRRTLKKRLA